MDFPYDMTGMNYGIITIMSIGTMLNLIVAFAVFWRANIPWEIYVLQRNIVVCDLLHLVFSGARVMSSKFGSFFQERTSACNLVYPIYTVTACNPNLGTVLIFAYQLHKTTLSCPKKNSKHNIKGLLVVNWIGCFFLFMPQLFVEDLTQVDQKCQHSNELIVEMRIAYWIGILYVQLLMCVVSVVYWFLSWKKITKLAPDKIEAKPTNGERSRPKELLSISNGSHSPLLDPDSSQVGGKQYVIRNNGSEHSECHTMRNIQHNHEAIKQNGKSTLHHKSKRDEHSRIVKFNSSTAVNKGSNATQKQHQKNNLLLLLAFLLSHLISLMPQNCFFIWYYFSHGVNSVTAFRIFEVTTIFTLINSLLNPIIFVAVHRYTGVATPKLLFTPAPKKSTRNGHLEMGLLNHKHYNNERRNNKKRSSDLTRVSESLTESSGYKNHNGITRNTSM